MASLFGPPCRLHTGAVYRVRRRRPSDVITRSSDLPLTTVTAAARPPAPAHLNNLCRRPSIRRRSATRARPAARSSWLAGLAAGRRAGSEFKGPRRGRALAEAGAGAAAALCWWRGRGRKASRAPPAVALLPRTADFDQVQVVRLQLAPLLRGF